MSKAKQIWSIFDCETGLRVSDRAYATTEEANHDYYMNAGRTFIGIIDVPKKPVRSVGDGGVIGLGV